MDTPANSLVRAIFFDFFGVIYLYREKRLNHQLLEYVRSSLKPHYRIGIITSTRDVTRYVPSELLAATVDTVVASSEAGLYKPNPEIFSLACQRLQIEPTAAVLVDDLPENCAGARAAGLQAILYADIVHLQRDLKAIGVQ